MKRTPLKRKTPLKAKAPMARKSPAKKRPIQKKKHGWRSGEYLSWVRSLPCCVCGVIGQCDAHHLIGMKAGLSGMGLTAPDQYAMPLCRACHTRMHNDTELQQMQWQYVAQTLARAVEQGPLEVSHYAA